MWKNNSVGSSACTKPVRNKDNKLCLNKDEMNFLQDEMNFLQDFFLRIGDVNSNRKRIS